jgi:Putative transposase/Transposase zinc-binding domain
MRACCALRGLCAHAHRLQHCRNRHCPKCQGAAAREWLADREAELLPVPYFHVVYRLPAALRDIAYQNKAVIYDLLFKVPAETTLAIAADPKHLGARIDFISVLHTWGSALVHHPHVHMIVLGGGLSPDASRWIACRPRYFLTVEVLPALFRALFVKMLLAAHEAEHLQFFGDLVPLAQKAAFKAYLKPLHSIDWVVDCKRPFAGPKQVLRYPHCLREGLTGGWPGAGIACLLLCAYVFCPRDAATSQADSRHRVDGAPSDESFALVQR